MGINGCPNIFICAHGQGIKQCQTVFTGSGFGNFSDQVIDVCINLFIRIDETCQYLEVGFVRVAAAGAVVGHDF